MSPDPDSPGSTGLIAPSNVPSPDPSILTTEAMGRLVEERAALVGAQLAQRDEAIRGVSIASIARADLLAAQLHGVEAELSERLTGSTGRITERLDAMDKANVVLSENVNRVPTNLQTAIQSATAFNDVKFESLQEALSVLRVELTNRFELLDRQTVREKAAADLAVNAAFAAADKAAAAAAAASTEAIRKSEAATAETIKTNAQAQIAGNNALSDKIDDDRDRMNRIEQLVTAIQFAQTGGRDQKSDSRAGNQGITAAIGAVVALILVAVTLYGVLKP